MSLRSDLKRADWAVAARPPSANHSFQEEREGQAGRELLSKASFSSGNVAHLPLKEFQVKSLKQVALRPSFRSREPTPGSQELLLQI